MHLRLLAAALLSISAAPRLAGQISSGPPVDLAELKRLATLPEAGQRALPNQTRLQRWFFDNVRAYHEAIRLSALGRSSLVNAGPPASPPGGEYRSTFAPPAGKGTCVILFSDGVDVATTWDDGSAIEFPRANISITGASDSTCWHESLHVLINRRPLSVRVEDFGRVSQLSMSKDRREAQEHVHIELVAERTTSWMRSLLQYEKEAVAAAELLDGLKRQKLVVNWETENFVWAKARAAWQAAWSRGGNRIPRIPSPAREEFDQPTATRFPTPEEAVGFYMSGDFKAPAGTKLAGQGIRVPKWVMWPSDASMPVIIEAVNQRGPDEKGGVFSASFGLTFSEARLQAHPPVTRGKAFITLETDDPSARISVSVGGKPIPASDPRPGSSYRQFVVNLAPSGTGPAASGPPPVVVGVSRSKPLDSPGAREATLPVRVRYRDDPLPGGSRKGALYLDTDGLFSIKLPAPGRSSGTGSPASRDTVSAAAAEPLSSRSRWVLAETFTWVPKPSEKLLDRKWTCAVSDGEATIDFWSSRSGRGEEWPWNHRLRYTWAFPRDIEAGSTLELRLKQENTFTSDNPMLTRCGFLVAGYRPSPFDKQAFETGGFGPSLQDRIEINMLGTPDSAGTSEGPPLVLRASGEGGGRYLVIGFTALCNYGIRGFSWARYEFESGKARGTKTPVAGTAVAGSASGPGPVGGSGSIESQIPPPPPLDKALNEEPPAPGELGGESGGGEETEPPATAGSASWYRHPLGDYRLRLADGWRQAGSSDREGHDQLEKGDGWRLYPKRSRGKASDLAGLLSRWSSAGGGTRPIELRIAGEAASASGKAVTDKGTPVVWWQIALVRGDRLYEFAAKAPPASGVDRVPESLSQRLSTLEFPTASSAISGEAGGGINPLVKQAVDLHDRKDYAQAIRILDQALRTDPGSAEALRRRGMSKREAGDFRGAIADFDESIRLEPGNATAWVGRGLTRERAGDHGGALSDYTKGLELDPNYMRAWGYRATLRMRRGDWSGAAADLDRGLGLESPVDWKAWAHASRGVAREKLGDTSGARQDWLRALELDPKEETARKGLNRLK